MPRPRKSAPLWTLEQVSSWTEEEAERNLTQRRPTPSKSSPTKEILEAHKGGKEKKNALPRKR